MQDTSCGVKKKRKPIFPVFWLQWGDSQKIPLLWPQKSNKIYAIQIIQSLELKLLFSFILNEFLYRSAGEGNQRVKKNGDFVVVVFSVFFDANKFSDVILWLYFFWLLLPNPLKSLSYYRDWSFWFFTFFKGTNFIENWEKRRKSENVGGRNKIISDLRFSSLFDVRSPVFYGCDKVIRWTEWNGYCLILIAER